MYRVLNETEPYLQSSRTDKCQRYEALNKNE